MKTCTKCKELKEFTEFSKNNAAKDGLYSYCKPCAKEVALKWNQANPEKFRANLKKYQYNTSGVYQILNNQNECLYIGQTIQFNGRKNLHKTFTKNPGADKQHTSLYKNLNKEGNITIKLVEECPKEILLEREQYWINKLKPKYNGEAN